MKKKNSSPCVKSHQNQIKSNQIKSTPFNFVFSNQILQARTFLKDLALATMSSFIDSTNVTRVVVVEGPQKMVIFKVWSEKKNSFKKRSRYLLWAILELRALCEGAAAAAKSETKNLSTCRIVTKANTLGVISFQWWFFMLNRGTHLRHQGALFGLVVKI